LSNSGNEIIYFVNKWIINYMKNVYPDKNISPEILVEK